MKFKEYLLLPAALPLTPGQQFNTVITYENSKNADLYFTITLKLVSAGKVT